MSKPEVLIFAPRDEPPELLKPLEDAGITLTRGNRTGSGSNAPKMKTR
jgi:hypothetical protein